MIELLLAATATALATGLGAIPVFLLGERAVRMKPVLIGIAAGVMTVASIFGLLLPGLDDGAMSEVAVGFAAGVGFLVAARATLGHRQTWRGRRTSASQRLSILVFAVLFVHSLPEGFAIGTAYASDTEGLGFFVVAAIAIQNIPEGTSVAIPLAATGAGLGRQFWAAVLTSAPQPVGAVVAYVLVEEVTALLPASFGFAAGAMLTLVVLELGPGHGGDTRRPWVLGALGGAVAMLAISQALAV